jgi:hypothetical protein
MVVIRTRTWQLLLALTNLCGVCISDRVCLGSTC